MVGDRSETIKSLWLVGVTMSILIVGVKLWMLDGRLHELQESKDLVVGARIMVDESVVKELTLSQARLASLESPPPPVPYTRLVKWTGQTGYAKR